MLTRISSVLGAVVLGAVLVASTYGAQAAGPHQRAHHPPVARAATGSDRFVAPVPHRYRADGLRMGLHCETAAMAMP